MNSFMSWIGGKKALRDEIIARFPTSYKKYIEVFGGGGWVLFRKPPNGDVEIFNDFNGNLVNLYRCVREHPEALIQELTYVLNARLDFEYMKEVLHSKAAISDIKRAAYYYCLIRYSYASGVRSFGASPHSMWNNFPLIRQASGRLQRVVIENRDCFDLITQYDKEDSFFYCDPPYYETERYYEGDGFGESNHAKLADLLCSIQGKFLLSYNDCPEIRQLYDRQGIYIESIRRLSNIVQRYDAGKEYPELLISNYDTAKAIRSRSQMTIFDQFGEVE